MIKITSLMLMISAVCSCNISNKKISPIESTIIKDNNIPKTIPNDKCENVKEVQIFQILGNDALAFICDSDIKQLPCNGHVVAIFGEQGKYFYDEQRIKAPSGKCVSYDGVIKYKTKNKDQKTVPIVKMVDSRIPAPEYEKDIN